MCDGESGRCVCQVQLVYRVPKVCLPGVILKKMERAGMGGGMDSKWGKGESAVGVLWEKNIMVEKYWRYFPGGDGREWKELKIGEDRQCSL